MKHISTIFKKEKYKKKPWLIVGKGPSFDQIGIVKIDDFNIFSLNSSISSIPNSDIAHIIDFEVYKELENQLYKKSSYVLLPINPHFKNKPSRVTIPDLINENKILKKLSKEGRLLWYNHLPKGKFLRKNNIRKIFYKKHSVKHFSAESAFSILGSYNIKKIYSVGVDGGDQYSSCFEKKNKLSNDQLTYNKQFNNIARSIIKYQITYVPITDVNDTINIFIANVKNNELMRNLCKFSIINNCPESEINFLENDNINYFSGKKILLIDSNSTINYDIRQVYNLPLQGHRILIPKDTNKPLSIAIFRKDDDNISTSYLEDIFLLLQNKEYNNINVSNIIPNYWNGIVSKRKPTKSFLTVFNDKNGYPWLKPFCPNEEIWLRNLFNSIYHNFLNTKAVEHAIKSKRIRPSILYQINNNIINSSQTSKKHKENIFNIEKPLHTL